MNKKLTPILAGILLGLSYPPFPTGIFAWFAFVPLLFYWKNHQDWKKSGYIAGIFANLVAFHWLAQNNGVHWTIALLTMILSVMFLALNFLILGWILQRFYRSIGEKAFWFFPVIWVMIEWLRMFTSLAFPWGSIGSSLLFSESLAQMASFGGVLGIGFWICTLNLLIFFAFSQFRMRWIIWIVIWIFVPFLAGKMLTHQDLTTQKTINIGIVQPNVDPNAKWSKAFRTRNTQILDSLSQQILEIAPETDLIILPETAVSAWLRKNRNEQQWIWNLVESNKISILTGFRDYEKNNGKILYFNSSGFFSPNGNFDFNPKSILVPFAEYVPFSFIFGWLDYLNLGQANFESAQEIKLFHAITKKNENVTLASEICYESSIPNLCQQFVQKGAEIVAVITNDGWYGKNSIEPAQHAHLARLRAIENRIPVVRSANTGVSCVIDPFGRIVSKLGNAERGILTANVPIAQNGTFYTKFGDWIGWFAFGVILFGFIKFRRKT